MTLSKARAPRPTARNPAFTHQGLQLNPHRQSTHLPTVVFHLVDGRQLDTMTFKLDGHPHLSAGVKPTHIGTPTPDAARRGRMPHLVDDRPGRLTEIQPLIPCCEL